MVSLTPVDLAWASLNTTIPKQAPQLLRVFSLSGLHLHVPMHGELTDLPEAIFYMLAWWLVGESYTGPTAPL